jgi:hypothetical protein
MSETLDINLTISHYRIAKKIGAGMGEVYRTCDKRFGRQTAKLPVGRIARASDSCNRRFPKPDAEWWIFRRRINK